ncbi:MAG: elongation factor P [Myxococcota bacterium]
MYETSDIRKGLKIIIDGNPFNVVEFQFVKPGKGQAFTRTKLKSMLDGRVIEKTFKSGEKLTPADIEERHMQYLYPEGDRWVFMDTETYDQISLDGDQIGQNRYYLQDGMEVDILLWEGRPIDITPPTFVIMEITETEPGFKGDTTSSITKPATVESGLEIHVPPFIDRGERVKIDTRTGDYVERVKK